VSTPRGALTVVLSLALLVALTAPLTSPLAAQESGTPSLRRLLAARGPLDLPALARDGAAPEVLLPAAPFPRAEPSSMRVIAVEVPTLVTLIGGSFYLAERGAWSTLGPRAGLIEPGDDDAVLYTLLVPALARAGENQAGLVRFVTANGARTFDVPLMVDVVGRGALTLSTERDMIGGRAGERVRATVTLFNAGNVSSEVSLRFSGATGWDAKTLVDGPLSVPRGGSLEVPIEIRIPTDASYGEYALNVAALDRDGNSATSNLGVQIARQAVGGSAGALSLADLTLGTAQDDLGSSINAVALEFQMPLPGDVRASGRYASVHGRQSGIAANALGRLGFADRVRQLQFVGPQWDASIGSIGHSGAGLAGLALFGDGVIASTSTDRWQGEGVALSPASQGTSGSYLLARGARRFGETWAGVLVSDLSDNVAGARYARTAAVDIAMPTFAGALRAQGGVRQTTYGDGAGWLVGLDQRKLKWGYSVNAGHTPGGASAFGQAQRTTSADAYRQLTPTISIAAANWTSSDNARADRRFAASGWSASSNWRPVPTATLGLDARGSSWESGGPLGLVANGDRSVGLSANGAHRLFHARASLRAGEVVRSADLAGLGTARTSAGQYSIQSGATLTLANATFSADVALDRTGAGVGMPARQASVDLRAERIPLMNGRVYGYAEYSAFVLGASGSTLAAQRVGLEFRLFGELGLTVDLSRNALFRRSAGEGTPWVIAMRLQRGLAFRGFGLARSAGHIFVDANANGVRDRGERGLAGVVVDLDGVVVTTDRNGEYRGPATESPRVEVRSLPAGHLVAASVPGRGLAGDIAIVSTAPVHVKVEVSNPERVPLGPVAMSKLIISLKDSRGRVWSNAADSAGVVRFDALPLGSYEILVDPSASGEALAAVGGTTTVEVASGGAPLDVTVRIAPRPMRLQPSTPGRRIQLDDRSTPPSAGTGATGSRGAP